jgi:hypothetical protein
MLVKTILAEKIMLSAFDCGHENVSMSYMASNQFCQGTAIRRVAQMKISLLQKADLRVVNGIECTMRISVASHVCGEWSHNHIVQADTIMKTVRLTSKECNTAFDTNKLFFDNRVISVLPHIENRAKFFVNGSVVLTHNVLNQQEVVCHANGIWIDNNFLEDGYQTMEIVFYMSALKMLQSFEGLSKLDGTFLGPCKTGCFDRTTTYVVTDHNITIADKVLNSDFRFIRDMYVEKIRMGRYTYIRNITQGFFIKLGGKQNICFATFCVKMYFTEVDNLMVFSEKNIFPRIDALEINDKIEAKVEIISESRLMFTLVENQPYLTNLCKLVSNPKNVHGTIEQFSRIIEFRGELIIFHQCVQQYFAIDLGVPFPCYKDIFVFQHNKKIMGVAPFTRLLVNVDHLNLIDCKSLPTFMSLDQGKFLVNLGKGIELKFFNISLNNFSDNIMVKDLFTSKERVKSSLQISRRLEEIQTNLYLSQLSSEELTVLQLQPGIWNDVAAFFSSFDFLNPYTWLKVTGYGLGLIMGFGTLWLILYLGLQRIMNIKCFERNIVMHNMDQGIPLNDIQNDEEELHDEIY